MRQHEEPQDLSPTGIARLRSIVEGLSVPSGTGIAHRSGDTVSEGGLMTAQVDSDALIADALHLLYDHHLIIPFDWERWDEGRAIFSNDAPDRFATLDRLTVLKLLTTVARNDRFSAGAWTALFDHGDGQKLLRRLLDLETNPPDLS